MKITCTFKIVMVAMLFAALSLNAAVTVNEFNLNRAKFQSYLDRAARQGDKTLIFKRGTYRVTGPLIVNKRVKILGAGRDATIILDSRRLARNSIFLVQAAGVTFEKLQIKGGTQVQSRFPFGVEEGSRVKQGIEIGIDIGPNALDLTVRNCKIRGVNVGINAGSTLGPSGLKVLWTDFTTGRGMVLGAFGENFTALQKKFIINGATYSRDRSLVQSDPGRGIVFDFGLVNVGRVQRGLGKLKTAVNLKGSIIKNCRFPIMSNWNVGMTRVQNVYIDLNTFNGGGGGNRNRFCHGLHFEDVCRNVFIRGNTFTQNYFQRIPRGRSHIWGGGFGKDNSPRITIQNHPNGKRNTFFGDVSYSLGGTVDGWSVSGCRFNNLKDSSRPNRLPLYIINGFNGVVQNRLNKNSDNKVNNRPIRKSEIRLAAFNPNASATPGGKFADNSEKESPDLDSAKPINVYTTPYGDLKISASPTGNKLLSIYDIQGRRMLSNTFTTNSYTIKKGDLKSGVYVLIMETTSGVDKLKFAVD